MNSQKTRPVIGTPQLTPQREQDLVYRVDEYSPFRPAKRDLH